MKKKKMGLRGLIVIILILIALFLSLIGFITDFLWFRELGYISVFFKKLFTQLKIGIPTFVIITILSYIYLKFLKRGYFKKVASTETTNHKRLNLISWGLAVVFALLVTFTAISHLWFEVLKFTNSTDFDIADPLFNMDISFYVFKLGFVQALNQILIAVIIAFVVLTLIYYVILLSVRTPQMFEEKEEAEEERYDGHFGQGGPGNFDNINDMFGKFSEAFFGKKKPIHRAKKTRRQFDDNNFMQLLGIAEKQLIVVGILFFLLVAVNFFLRQYDLLYGQTGAVHGAGFTDVTVTLWMYRIIMGLSVLAAIAFAVGVSKRKFKTVLTLPVLMIAVGLLGTGAAALVQNLVVSPDEINKESKYLERNIEYTRYAYDLSNVTVKPFAASNDLTGADINNNMETISNIRINDYEPAEKFYNQTQSIRPYYTFNDVDVDRYMINGEYTQTFLSPREIDEEKINDSWLNKHLKYTHGYGITLSRVDKVTSSGQPDMMIDSIPPVSEVEEIEINRPEIYFGEKTNNYILTNTKEEEFDYPDGDNNKYAMYEGSAGIELNLLNKTMFAIRERSLKLLVSSNIRDDSRIIINRNIEERVNKIMPYLEYDQDPYIVTVDGKLYWIIDAYTTTSRYPYSQSVSGSNVNYIRNSVKVVIDAYNGTTNYYLVDDQDPIANTFKKIYPKLFRDFDKMPAELQKHIRYPSMMLSIQAQIYQRYHMTDVKVFYQNEDLWEISKEIYGTEAKQMEPNYYIMKLPGEKNAEFVNSIPYTPKNKTNMTGLLVARNDGEEYGNLVLYQLPKSKIIYGPTQIEAQIDQNTEISKEFSLWNSAGSKYSRGNMFVIPIEESLLYVEPVYLEATNSSIPEVKRVIVAYGDRIAYEATLAEALESLFGEGSADGLQQSGTGTSADNKGDEKGPATLTKTELAQKAQEAFTNAQKAQQDGDWAKYGEYLDDLESYLNQLAPAASTDTPDADQ